MSSEVCMLWNSSLTPSAVCTRFMEYVLTTCGLCYTPAGYVVSHNNYYGNPSTVFFGSSPKLKPNDITSHVGQQSIPIISSANITRSAYIQSCDGKHSFQTHLDNSRTRCWEWAVCPNGGPFYIHARFIVSEVSDILLSSLFSGAGVISYPYTACAILKTIAGWLCKLLWVLILRGRFLELHTMVRYTYSTV